MLDIKDIYTPIGQLFGREGYTKDISETILGVEFENETKEPFEHPNVRGWQFQPEGSLRYCGFEYVLRTPCPIYQAKGHIQNLFKWIDTRRGDIPLTNSIRTSTHIHFDVTKWNYIDLLRFSTVYWTLEETLSAFCGETRKGNLFCLRLKDAMYAQHIIAEALEQRKEIYPRYITHNDYRYASLNFSSIPKFGSLEFRMMRGVSGVKDVYIWIDILEKIKSYSFALETPLDVKEAFLKKHNADSYAKDILGEELFSIVSKHLSKDFSIASSTRDAFMQVSPIFSVHKTWDFKEDIEKLKKQQEEEYEAAKKRSKYSTVNWNDVVTASTVTGWAPQESLTVSLTPPEETSSPDDPDYGADNMYYVDDESYLDYGAPLEIQTYGDC